MQRCYRGGVVEEKKHLARDATPHVLKERDVKIVILPQLIYIHTYIHATKRH